MKEQETTEEMAEKWMGQFEEASLEEISKYSGEFLSWIRRLSSRCRELRKQRDRYRNAALPNGGIDKAKGLEAFHARKRAGERK